MCRLLLVGLTVLGGCTGFGIAGQCSANPDCTGDFCDPFFKEACHDHSSSQVCCGLTCSMFCWSGHCCSGTCCWSGMTVGSIIAIVVLVLVLIMCCCAVACICGTGASRKRRTTPLLPGSSQAYAVPASHSSQTPISQTPGSVPAHMQGPQVAGPPNVQYASNIPVAQPVAQFASNSPMVQAAQLD